MGQIQNSLKIPETPRFDQHWEHFRWLLYESPHKNHPALLISGAFSNSF